MATPPGPRLRLLLGAFGDPGHAFPMIALGRELAARGHEVTLQTWRRWAEPVGAEGMAFVAAPEYHEHRNGGQPLKPYAAVQRAAAETQELVEQVRPHAVVADILTLAPALAGERAGAPVATLIPHVHPAAGPGFAPYSMGARLPRTVLGRRLWAAAEKPMTAGLRQGRDELNETRTRLDLPTLEHFHAGISRDLALVASFPQLEYPRPWPAQTHVVGPLMWEPPAPETPIPPGRGPLVLIAPSTSQDPDHVLLRAALTALADLPVRVLATWNGRLPRRPLPHPANAQLVDWVRYSTTMPHCDVVICHAGHGTVVRAMSSGATVLACPAAGDMNENAARVDWAGVGVRLPRRYVTTRSLRLAIERLLSKPELARRSQMLAAWGAAHPGPARAADLVEGLARRQSPSPA